MKTCKCTSLHTADEFESARDFYQLEKSVLTTGFREISVETPYSNVGGEVERWFEYRDNRNDTAHDYGLVFAETTLKLLPTFLADAKALHVMLKNKLGSNDAGS